MRVSGPLNWSWSVTLKITLRAYHYWLRVAYLNILNEQERSCPPKNVVAIINYMKAFLKNQLKTVPSFPIYVFYLSIRWASLCYDVPEADLFVSVALLFSLLSWCDVLPDAALASADDDEELELLAVAAAESVNKIKETNFNF